MHLHTLLQLTPREARRKARHYEKFACRQVAISDTGDFPKVVEIFLRKQQGSDAAVILPAGFDGNIFSSLFFK